MLGVMRLPIALLDGLLLPSCILSTPFSTIPTDAVCFNNTGLNKSAYIEWPPRSPVLTRMNFFVWSTIRTKYKIHVKKPTNVYQLRDYNDEFRGLHEEAQLCRKKL
jgi:hypothetical protein